MTEAREGLMRVSSRILLFVFAPALFLSFLRTWTARPDLHASYAAVFGLVVIVSAVAWVPVRRFLVWQALLLIAGFLAAFAVSGHSNGPQPGATAAACVAVAWATLFFGRRGMFAVLASLLVVQVWLAWHFIGAMPPHVPDLLPESPAFWVRTTIGVLGCAALIGLIVLTALHAYLQTVERERDALAAAAREEQARLAAEAESDILQRRQMIGALAGGLAHDLNNVIHVTAVSAALLQESATTDEDRGLLEQITAAAERARRMVRELLALGRELPSEARATGFDGAEVIHRLAAMLRSAIPRQVQTEFAADDGCLLAGRVGRFEQVIINLVMNARDAMPNGGSLSVALRVADDRLCRLDVRDTGLGIAPEVRDRIFLPFFTTKPTGEGSGVGLSSVARAVKDVGGRVTFESAQGQGTLFSVFWPRLSGSDSAAP